MQTLISLATLFCITLVNVSLQTSAYADESVDWQPDRPITMIVPSNPGGGWDQTGRFMQRAIVTEDLSPVSVEVINRGGAGGTIGLAELVERYPGDPHKLLISGFGMTGSILMHGSKHNLLSTTPIARLTSEYQAIGVPADSSIQSLDDLIELFRKDPKSVSWGGGSAGGSDHIFAFLLAEAAGVDAANVNYVAFTGGGEAAAALLGGQVTAGISGFGEWGSMADSGRVRLLAVSSEKRLLSAEELPTFQELGIDIVFSNWRCILAAPGINRVQKEWMIKTITEARASSVWQEVLARNNWTDSFLVGEEFEKFIIEDSGRTARTLARVGLGAGGESWAAVGPYLFPTLAGIGLLLTGGVIAISSFKNRKLESLPGNVHKLEDDTGPIFRQFFLAAGTVFLYILGLRFIGFMYVTPVLIVALSWVIGSRNILRDAIVGSVLTGLIIAIFENFLNVQVP